MRKGRRKAIWFKQLEALSFNDCCFSMTSADTVLPQNGFPITDVVVAHAHDSRLFCDLGAKYFYCHITKRVRCHLINPLAHLLQRNFPIKNQELFGWC